MLDIQTQFCRCFWCIRLFANRGSGDDAQATSVTLAWNSTGTALLATTASDTDATNQSYYGEQKLHFLAADGSLDCLVPVKARSSWPRQSAPACHQLTPSEGGLAVHVCLVVWELSLLWACHATVAFACAWAFATATAGAWVAFGADMLS